MPSALLSQGPCTKGHGPPPRSRHVSRAPTSATSLTHLPHSNALTSQRPRSDAAARGSARLAVHASGNGQDGASRSGLPDDSHRVPLVTSEVTPAEPLVTSALVPEVLEPLEGLPAGVAQGWGWGEHQSELASKALCIDVAPAGRQHVEQSGGHRQMEFPSSLGDAVRCQAVVLRARLAMLAAALGKWMGSNDSNNGLKGALAKGSMVALFAAACLIPALTLLRALPASAVTAEVSVAIHTLQPVLGEQNTLVECHCKRTASGTSSHKL